MERSLATVETIVGVTPIEGADKIEAAQVRGWTIVVKKGEFSVGDKCVYVEIDSFVPVVGPFAFLADRNTRSMVGVEHAGHVLKTIRLRGTYSQGLAIPLAEFPELVGSAAGDDVTEMLGIVKYEPPVPASLGGESAGGFPTKYAQKTDSERVQNIGEWAWEQLRTEGEWYATEKIDGSSITVFRDEEGVLRCCSRNWELRPSGNTFWKHVPECELLEPGEYVQGEVFGEGIQKNPLNIAGTRIALYTYGVYGQVKPRTDWPEWALDLSVPVLDLTLPDTVEACVAQVDGIKSAISPSKLAEGVVWHERTAKGFHRLGGRSNFKAISNKYLVKNEG